MSTAAAEYFRRFGRQHLRKGKQDYAPEWPVQHCWACGRFGKRQGLSRCYRCEGCDVEWTARYESEASGEDRAQAEEWARCQEEAARVFAEAADDEEAMADLERHHATMEEARQAFNAEAGRSGVIGRYAPAIVEAVGWLGSRELPQGGIVGSANASDDSIPVMLSHGYVLPHG